MSSRRPPEWDEDEWDDQPSRGGRRTAPAPARRFGVAAVAAALVGGLFVGYVANSGGGGTTTVTQSRTVTAPTDATAAAGVNPSPASARATISLAVLNGSDESGLAATGADEARGLGYQRVSEGNAPAPVSADLVLHRAGAAPQAARVAQDLQLPTPELATDGDPVLDAAPDADVIVVLGPSGGSGTPAGGAADDPAAGDTLVDPTATTPTG